MIRARRTRLPELVWSFRASTYNCILADPVPFSTKLSNVSSMRERNLRTRSGPGVPSVLAYLRIRPSTLSDAVRLYAAYVASALVRPFVPPTRRAVGLRVRGHRNLQVSVKGIRFEVRNGTNDLDLISPKYEPVTSDWFRVGPNEVVVDVGAHIGRYTLAAAVHAAVVIAIEPDLGSFRLLDRNVRLNGFTNVILVSKALSSKAGTRPLQLPSVENTGTATLEPPHGRRGPDRSTVVLVPTDTLDHIVRENHLTRIDWLKIDVEGHEVEVLRGGESALAMTRRLILEVTDSSAPEARRILESAGFETVLVEEGDPTSNWLLANRGKADSAAMVQ